MSASWRSPPSCRPRIDTKRYIDAIPALTEEDRAKIFEANARRVYPRLDAHLKARAASAPA